MNVSPTAPRSSWASPGPAIVVRSPARVTPCDCGCGSTDGTCSCQGGGAGASPTAAGSTPVYAFGTLRMVFPSKSMEAEMQRALASMHAAAMPGVVPYFDVHSGYGLQLLGQGQYDYLFRDACFILTIGKIDAYLVQARSTPELQSMVAAANQLDDPTIYSAIIGQLGPIAGPQACNGLQLPIVYCNQIFSMPRLWLTRHVQSYFSAEGNDAPLTAAQTQQLSLLGLQMTDNMGASPEHRALNYVALRYPLVYEITADMYGDGYMLLRIEVTPGRAPDERDVVFVYQRLEVGQVVQWRCSIDVSGMYPYITQRLSQSFPTHPHS